MPSARPRNSENVPSVTISGGKASRVMSRLFKNPAPAPTIRVTIAAATIGRWASRQSMPKMTAVSPMSDPTDRSIPQVTMTGVMATAIRPTSTLSRTISKAFAAVKKFLPRNANKTTSATTKTARTPSCVIASDGCVRRAAARRTQPSLAITQEGVLAVFVVAEVVLFAFLGKNFFTAANAFEIVRLSVEVGLIAVAMTPVIVTCGIDLSVGSLMGLTAVIFGMLWRDAHLPIVAAAIVTLIVGAGAGFLNSLLITRLALPPLIVTLGTFSLFRGLAEGMTRGVENYTSLPHS